MAKGNSETKDVTVDSLIEKTSPGDGARFWSLSCTITSKRHSGVVGVSCFGHALGKPAGAPDVSR